jgi:hypothetical protein
MRLVLLHPAHLNCQALFLFAYLDGMFTAAGTTVRNAKSKQGKRPHQYTYCSSNFMASDGTYHTQLSAALALTNSRVMGVDCGWCEL